MTGPSKAESTLRWLARVAGPKKKKASDSKSANAASTSASSKHASQGPQPTLSPQSSSRPSGQGSSSQGSRSREAAAQSGSWLCPICWDTLPEMPEEQKEWHYMACMGEFAASSRSQLTADQRQGPIQAFSSSPARSLRAATTGVHKENCHSCGIPLQNTSDREFIDHVTACEGELRSSVL